MRSAIVLAVVLTACSGSSEDKGSPDAAADVSAPADGDLPPDGPIDAAPPPKTSCVAPVELADTSKPTTVVGTGTAASCTEAAFGAAVAKGGVVTFDCGADPVTITLSSEKVAPNDRDTVIDGAGKITLSGGGKTRIVALRHSFEKLGPKLTVQRLAFTDGFTTDVPNTTETKQGGAAIYRLGGELVIVDSTFTRNVCPLTGQDVAGGAVYSVGGGDTTIVRSAFVENRCSNGGAIGALGSGLRLVDVRVEKNRATGNAGNPGNGGNGGGVCMDGKGKVLSICGSILAGNTGNAFGGALFRTSYEGEPTTIDRTSVLDNAIPKREPGSKEPSMAGGLYLQGTKVSITSSTIARNAANSVGGVFFAYHGTAPGSFTMENVTLALNQAWPQADFTKQGLAGGISANGEVTGVIKSCTIVGNVAQFAAGIANVSGLEIVNTIVANSAANKWTPLNCTGRSYDKPLGKGAPNLQWPDPTAASSDIRCTDGTALFADPHATLGPLQDNGGPTPTMKLLAGSPAIGKGSGCPAVDQRGIARKTCDLGAVAAD